jgi:hypothetical protein
MIADEIRAYQGEALNRLAAALAKVHGIAFSAAGMQQADVARFVTELLETASVPPGRDGHEIELLIDAWIELDDLARSMF